MSQRLRVGMVGYKFMGKAHSNAYRSLPMFSRQHRCSLKWRSSAAGMKKVSRKQQTSSAGPKV